MIYNVKSRKTVSRGKKRFLILVALVVAVGVPVHLYSNIRPLVSSIAESRVESVVMKAINDAAVKVISENAVGTPSSGDDVPTRPGTISIICLCRSR